MRLRIYVSGLTPGFAGSEIANICKSLKFGGSEIANICKILVGGRLRKQLVY